MTGEEDGETAHDHVGSRVRIRGKKGDRYTRGRQGTKCVVRKWLRKYIKRVGLERDSRSVLVYMLTDGLEG